MADFISLFFIALTCYWVNSHVACRKPPDFVDVGIVQFFKVVDGTPPPFQFAALWRRALVPDIEGWAQRHGLSQLGEF